MSSKMRDAVSRLVREIEDGMLVELSSKFESDLAKSLLADVKTALAEPVRNCDIGTPEEQAKQFILFCRRNSFRGVCNDSCKFGNINRRLGWQEIGQARCFPFWAQMPYESEVK